MRGVTACSCSGLVCGFGGCHSGEVGRFPTRPPDRAAWAMVRYLRREIAGRSLFTYLCQLGVAGQVLLEFAVAELVADACLPDQSGVETPVQEPPGLCHDFRGLHGNHDRAASVCGDRHRHHARNQMRTWFRVLSAAEVACLRHADGPVMKPVACQPPDVRTAIQRLRPGQYLRPVPDPPRHLSGTSAQVVPPLDGVLQVAEPYPLLGQAIAGREHISDRGPVTSVQPGQMRLGPFCRGHLARGGGATQS